MNPVIRPFIPYRGVLPGGLHDGKRIEITGQVPYGADVFRINLKSGIDTYSDELLHISVRFNGRVVVRNALKQNCYGPEERYGSFPFTQGRAFTMVILVNCATYKISVNGQHCWEFSHRMPFTRVSAIAIDGDVQIDRIEFINNYTPFQHHASSTPVSISRQISYQQPAPSMLLSGTPFIFPIYGGLRPGMKIHINGRPLGSPRNFSINLQNGSSPIPAGEIAFHFDVRFFNYTIVRNTRSYHSWGTEETMISHFPFQPGVTFGIVIKVQQNRYSVDVNGKHFVTFRHRLNPLSQFNTLYIADDVIVTRPYIFPIYGGVKTGMLIHISGKTLEDPHKFTVNLQHGSSPIPSPDIALHINVGFYNSSIVRNSRYNGVWGLEENFIENFPFQPGANFSIVITVQPNRYAIVINSQYTIPFIHRLNSAPLIDTLYIDNDAVISSIRCVGI